MIVPCLLRNDEVAVPSPLQLGLGKSISQASHLAHSHSLLPGGQPTHHPPLPPPLAIPLYPFLLPPPQEGRHIGHLIFPPLFEAALV